MAGACCMVVLWFLPSRVPDGLQVRWAVAVVLVAGTVQATSLVDIGRCKNSCSSVPEDLWPSCCEVHNTCCQEFAESCMHDCLPRVHTGDVSVVEERPGMCCALYNLCCFRETFRISSSKTAKQEPVSFPIVHRFHVKPPTPEQASKIPAGRPAPRPSFQPGEQNENSPRPSLPKKSFRPSQSDGFKKLPEDDNTDDSKKPRTGPKFSSLLNRNLPETRGTRRPAGVDIRQEVSVPEVSRAEPMGGSRRLDASINPVVTRKRLLVNSTPRQPRTQVEKSEPEERGPRGRKLQDAPAREGRKLSGGRSASRPSPPQSNQPSPPQSNRPSPPQSNRPAASQQSTRSQPAVPETSRPSTRTPAKAPPTSPQPAQVDTPKTTAEVKPSAAPATEQPVKESESPDVVAEASDTVDTILSVVEASDTPANPTTTPSAAEADTAAETNPEAAEEKAAETPSEPAEAEKETNVAEPAEASENTAFSPPEIEVNIPEVPKVTNPRAEEPAATQEPAQERGNSRSTGTRGQEASRGQSRTRNEEQTQGRTRTTTRGQTGDRTTSRTASQTAERQDDDSAHQSAARGRSRTRS